VKPRAVLFVLSLGMLGHPLAPTNCRRPTPEEKRQASEDFNAAVVALRQSAEDLATLNAKTCALKLRSMPLTKPVYPVG